MDNDDYTGLFVQMGEQVSDPNTEGIDSCDFIETGDSAVAYDVRLIDEIEDDHRIEETNHFSGDTKSFGGGVISDFEEFLWSSHRSATRSRPL